MTPRYAREISALLEGVAENVPEPRLRDLLGAARERHRSSLERTRLHRETVLGHERPAAVADEMLARLGERERLLEAWPVDAARLREISAQITSLSAQLERERRMLPQDVPLPVLDDALKAARNLHKGLGDPTLLGARLEQLKALREQYAGEADLFRGSYPHHQALAQRLSAALAAFESAIGALERYLTAPSERRGDLSEACELLQGAAIDLNSGLNAMGQVRRQEGFSEVPVLDAFARAARGRGELTEHFERLLAFLAEQEAECRRFRDSVLLSPRGEQVWDTTMRPVLERFATTLETARAEPDSERKQMELFRLGQELLNKKKAWMEKGAQSRSFAADPELEELLEGLKGWYAGSTPRPFLLEQLERADANARRLLGAARGEEGLVAAIQAPLTSFARLREACLEDDRPGVAAALHELEAAFDRWLWARETVRLQEPVEEPPAVGESLFTRLTRALESEQRLADIRPLLSQCHVVVRDASRRLAAWHQSNASAVSDDADLERVASELEVHVRSLEATLGALLARGDGSLEDHAEALEDVRELLLRLGETRVSQEPSGLL